MKQLLIILLLLICSISCSSYKVTKVTDANRDEIRGLRFFLPSPYLLVAEKDLLVEGLKTVKESSAGKTTTTQKMAVARRELQCSVIYLPNPEQEYAISKLSEEEIKTIHFEDGWRLTGFSNPKSSILTAGQLWLLSGTKDLQAGMYAVNYKNGKATLEKVEIVP